MNDTLNINWIQPDVKSYMTAGNALTAMIDFRDGRGAEEIIIKRGNGYWMWIDRPFQIRKFTSLEYMAYEFELPMALVLSLRVMTSGEVVEQPYMDVNLMSAALDDYKQNGRMKKSYAGSNVTPKKKKRK